MLHHLLSVPQKQKCLNMTREQIHVFSELSNMFHLHLTCVTRGDIAFKSDHQLILFCFQITLCVRRSSNMPCWLSTVFVPPPPPWSRSLYTPPVDGQSSFNNQASSGVLIFYLRCDITKFKSPHTSTSADVQYTHVYCSWLP